MKTLSYYQNLREEYACIIPKTAPAYELIEALDVLIASLQLQPETQPHFLGVPVDLLAQIDDDGNYSIFDYYGQQLRIPKGWRMEREGKHTVTYTIVDANNVAFGKVRKTTDGYAWASVDRNPGITGYYATQLDALKGLIDRAWWSVDAP